MERNSESQSTVFKIKAHSAHVKEKCFYGSRSPALQHHERRLRFAQKGIEARKDFSVPYAPLSLQSLDLGGGLLPRTQK